MKILAWLLSLFFAFNLGAEKGTAPKASDDELRGRVQEHIDVIVDESAAIVDEVTDELRNSPAAQDAEKYARDVREIAEGTLTDLNQVVENTKDRVEEKFGTGDAPALEEDTVEAESLPELTEEAAETESLPAVEEDAVETEAAGDAPESELPPAEALPEAELLPGEETPAPGEPVNG